MLPFTCPFSGGGFILWSGQVVRKMDCAIHWINLYPVDGAIGFPNTYPLDSNLSSRLCYPVFEQPRPDGYVPLNRVWFSSLRALSKNQNWQARPWPDLSF